MTACAVSRETRSSMLRTVKRRGVNTRTAVSAAATTAVAAGYRPFVTLDGAWPTLGGYDRGDPLARKVLAKGLKRTS